jgi:hypothetical protein
MCHRDGMPCGVRQWPTQMMVEPQSSTTDEETAIRSLLTRMFDAWARGTAPTAYLNGRSMVPWCKQDSDRPMLPGRMCKQRKSDISTARVVPTPGTTAGQVR